MSWIQDESEKADDQTLQEKSYLVERLESHGFSRESILLICQAINETCQSCWQSDSDCRCWNDE